MSRVNVRVRQAQISDVDALVTLTKSIDTSIGIFGGHGKAEPDEGHLATRFAEIIDEGTRTMLVAVDDTNGTAGSIVGLLVAKRDDMGAIDLTPVLHVTHLIVTPKARRRGVGRALLAACVHLADEWELDRVLATVASSSREANRYMARLGFAPLVLHRVASTGVLRRALGMSDEPQRVAVLRRARLLRAQRAGFSVRRGA